MAGARTTAPFTDLGVVEMKGLPAPVAVCEVGWVPVPAGAGVPLPALLRPPRRVFVGRAGELERLGQLWKEATAGDRRVALLAGEPGIGKTRLAAQLAGAVHDEGAVVLAGQCDEDVGVPYQPFVGALRHYVAHATEPRLGRYAGELPRLLPELAMSLPGLPEPLRSDPETEQYRLFDAVTAWLADVSSAEPVLLVLDDLHWAAKPTLLLLRHVLRSPEPLRLLLVVTYRDSEIGRHHPLTELLADLRRIEGVERFSITGLDPAAVAAFLEEAGGHELDDTGEELARLVWQETEGNPFFVTELLRHLADTRALVQQDGRWVLARTGDALGIPEGIRDVIGRRLSRLSDEANRILACAAVFGHEFDPAIVGRAGGFPEESVLATLAEAEAARLVVDVPGPAPRCRFVHALVKATLYDELTAAGRAALHRKAAEAIEAVYGTDLDDYLPALAHHWARASMPAPETGKAARYAAQAGDRALAQLANDEAATFYRQALELFAVAGRAEDTEERLGLLIALGEAQRRAGDAAYRDTLLDAAHLAQQRGDATALGRAALGNTRGHLMTVFGAVDNEIVRVLEAAITATADSGVADAAIRAKLLAALALELTFGGDWRRCLALSDDALGLARSLDDPDTSARVLLARFFPTHVPNLLEERVANTAELVRAAAAVADPALAARAHLLRGRAAMEFGDIDEADRCFAVADRLSLPLGQPTLRWQVTYVLGARQIIAGRFAEARRLLDESRQLGHLAGHADVEWIFALQAFQLGDASDRLDSDTVALIEATTAPWSQLNQTVLAVAACRSDRSDDARRALDRLSLDSIPFDPWWLLSVTNLATVAAYLGDTACAAGLEAALRPYVGQAVPYANQPSPSVAHQLGLLATTLSRYDEADRYFGDAFRIHERIGAAHWLARTRLEWARMLLTRRDRGDSERAHQLLDQALAVAEELGLEKVACRTRELRIA
jgi:predicted ATPase